MPQHARLVAEDELHAGDLETEGVTDETIVRINQQGDIEVRRIDRWDVIGGLLGATASTLFVVPIIYSYLREKPPANQARRFPEKGDYATRIRADRANYVEVAMKRGVDEPLEINPDRIDPGLLGENAYVKTAVGLGHACWELGLEFTPHAVPVPPSDCANQGAQNSNDP